MNRRSLGDAYLSGILWVLIDKFGGGGLNFLVTILLARLLTPEDFGLVAMVMILFDICTTMMESGFSAALIRQKEISAIDKSTTFFFNFVASILLYALLYVGAPSIASFFAAPALESIVRVMGLILIINSFSIVQHAVFSQKIDYKTLARVRIFTILISSVVAIAMAYLGYGVWSLVAQFGLMSLINTMVLCYLNRWWPSFRFSTASFRRLFNFGYKVLLAGLLNRLYRHIYQLLIGRFFAAATLGLYSQAAHFKKVTALTVFETVNKVTYPFLAKIQDDQQRFKEVYRTVIRLNTFVLVPSMVLLGVLAEPFIVVLVGEKWMACVPMLQLLCVSGVIYHFSRIFHHALLARGRSDLTLRLEIFYKVSITISILVGVNFGLYGLIWSEIVSAYINLLISVWYTKTYLAYSIREQVTDVWKTFAISLTMGTALLFFVYMQPGTPVLHLIAGGLAGGVIYLALHLLLRTQELAVIRDIVIPRTMRILTNASAA